MSWFAVPLLLMLASPARAAEFGTVQALAITNGSGGWEPVDTSVRAWVERPDGRVPLTLAMPLQEGDRVRTLEARVELDLGQGERVIVGPQSDVTLRPRGMLQRAGELYYRLRSAFAVELASVQTTVEGTEFAVAGSSEATVVVVEGAVRVEAGGKVERVARWQQVVASEGGVPEPQLSPFAAAGVVQRSWPGPRPFELGVGLSGGLFAGGAAPSLEAFGAATLAGPLRARFGAGLRLPARPDTLHVPLNLGLDYSWGAWSAGAAAEVATEVGRLGCEGEYLSLHVGGYGALRLTTPLSRRQFVSAELRAGWVDGPLALLGVGVGWAP